MKNGNATIENNGTVALIVKEKEELLKDVLSLETKVTSLKIVDTESRNMASFLLTAVKEAYKNAEAKRKEFVDPLNSTVKRINATFKLITEPLEKLESIIKREQIRDYNEQERIKREEDERIRKEEEKKQRELEARMKRTKDEEKKKLLEQEQANTALEAKQKLEDNAQTVQTSVKTGVGSTTFKKVWKYELVDLSKVPHEYLVLNETKVGGVVRAGVREIPGIRIYEDIAVAGR